MQYIAYKFTAYTHAFMVDKLLLHVCHKHHQGCIFFYNPPPPGVGEKNQRVLGLGKKSKKSRKMERQREKKRKISVGTV